MSVGSDTIIEKLVFSFGVYEGSTDRSTGLRHGRGVLRYSNGNVYDGSWVLGAASGRGRKHWANGDVYEGSFDKGKKSGEGRYTFANGAVYVGAYADDQPNGHGLQLMPNGDTYEGEWVDGRKHGFGVETLHSGQRFEGSFQRGKKNGQGILSSPSGSVVSAIWEGDRCIRVLSESEGDIEEGVASSDAKDSAVLGDAPMSGDQMIAEMEAAGLDRELISQIAHFNTAVFNQMSRVVDGLGSLDAHLHDLQDCVDAVDGGHLDTALPPNGSANSE